jgi:hypothetical protein
MMDPSAAAAAAAAEKEMTKADFLEIGLETAGHPKWKSYKHERDVERFFVAYGADHVTINAIWNDLRDAGELDATNKPVHFLLSPGKLLSPVKKLEVHGTCFWSWRRVA